MISHVLILVSYMICSARSAILPYYEIPTKNPYAEDYTETQCEDPPNICPYNNQDPSRYSSLSTRQSGVGFASSLDAVIVDEELHAPNEDLILDPMLQHNLNHRVPPALNGTEEERYAAQMRSMRDRYPQCSLEDAVWYHTVIMISLDGFHPRYLNLNETPVLDALIKGGTFSDAMQPTFPTYTFPNHMTLMTGLYPDVHGIVNNEFCDSDLKKCFNKRTMMEPCWYQADPLWNTVQDFGIKSASVYWIGSEVCIGGRRPNYVVPFSKSCGGLSFRIGQLIRWLSLPAAVRPTFLSCYVSIMDDVGHASGPDSDKIVDALKELNDALAVLMQGLKDKRVDDKVSIIIVSDHGMQSTDREYFIYFEDIIPLDRVQEVSVGPVAFIRGKTPQDTQDLYTILKERERSATSPLHFKTYKKEELVSVFNFGSSGRVADIILIADPHYQVTLKAIKWTPKGLHGYPLPNEDMHAVFIAKSPHLRPEFPTKLTPFSNRDVYPFLCRLLNVTGNPCNGTNFLVDQLLSSGG